MSNFQGTRAPICLMAAAALSLLVAFGASAQTIRYIHTDGLGSPVLVTDEDRNVVERSEYDPYGSLLNRPLMDGPGYTGHVTDLATTLTYMQQRYYDPVVGRFLSVDPVEADADTGDDFNRYAYGLNNPYTLIDPDGRKPEDKKVPEPQPAPEPASTVVLPMPAPVQLPPVTVTAPKPSPLILPIISDVILTWGPRASLPLLLIATPHPCGGRPCGELDMYAKEHTKNARPSTKGKHEKGRARARSDKHGGEKGDERRDPYGRKPPGHKGPWPPK